MLGRGALGNPWVYRQIEAVIAGQVLPPSPGFAERKRMALEHAAMQERFDPWPVGPLRRVICWYFKDVPGVAGFRDKINRSQTVEEMREHIEAFRP
jgi:tRNA-dihydrouridine synthase B